MAFVLWDSRLQSPIPFAVLTLLLTPFPPTAGLDAIGAPSKCTYKPVSLDFMPLTLDHCRPVPTIAMPQ
jgi:hypothetical protein